LKNGFGFAYFSDRRDAEDSVKEFDGVEFHGKRLKVELARGSSPFVESISKNKPHGFCIPMPRPLL
jgi:RNA recognition motif-containing protein